MPGARPIWNGAISCGLLNCPVKLFSATKEQTVRFSQINKETGNRVRQKRVDDRTGKTVPYESIVKGYEVANGQFVTFDDDELEALAPEKTRQIALSQFADEREINLLALGKPYYLGPADGGANAYALLVQTLASSGKMGVGRMVLRSKESVAFVSSRDGVLVCQLALFPDEVLPSAEFAAMADGSQVAERELAMAHQLVSALSAPLDYASFKDEHRERVLKAIERKAQGLEPERTVPSPETAVPDLMAALEASLAQVRAAETIGS